MTNHVNANEHRSHKIFVRHLILSLTLLGLSSLITQSQAHESQGHQDHFEEKSWGHDREFRHGRDIEEHVENVYRNFRGKRRFDLLYEMGFNRSDRGKQIVGVGLDATSAVGKGKAQIKINGDMQERKTLPRHLYDNDEVYFDVSGNYRIGENLRDLVLEMRGNIQLNKVIVYTQKDYRGGPGGPGGRLETFSETVDDRVSRYDNFKVGRAFRSHLPRLRGSKLVKVSLEVESARYGTEAQLLINGQPASRFKRVSERRRRYGGSYRDDHNVSFHVDGSTPDTIGGNLKSVQVKFTDGATVREVEIQVGHRGRRGGPRDPRDPRDPRNPRHPRNEFRAPLHVRAAGHTETTLVDEVRMPFRMQTRQARRVELKVKAKGRARMRVCERNYRHRPTNCQNVRMRRPGMQTVSVSLHMQAKDIMLVTDGYVEFKAVRIHF